MKDYLREEKMSLEFLEAANQAKDSITKMHKFGHHFSEGSECKLLESIKKLNDEVGYLTSDINRMIESEADAFKVCQLYGIRSVLEEAEWIFEKSIMDLESEI